MQKLKEAIATQRIGASTHNQKFSDMQAHNKVIQDGNVLQAMKTKVCEMKERTQLKSI